jgi:acyl-coenzyme A synthetase/AMP-(fatty) acid ligase
VLAAPQDAYPFDPQLRVDIVAGAISQAQVDELKRRVSPRIWNRLGSTEANAIAMTLLETPEDRRWYRLLPGRRAEIVDDDDRPTPRGQIGRLRVGTEDGPGGYLNDPDATRAFFKDGFFYPGDLAVMHADGRIALEGRSTDVIVIDGVKLSPQPIEDRLQQALGVAGVCLISLPDAAGADRLCLVIERQAPLAMESVAAALARELPPHTATTVLYTPLLPRDDLGKLARGAVREGIRAAG